MEFQVKSKHKFEINDKNHKYVWAQFPMILAYIVTAYTSQGDSLEKVNLDFTKGKTGKKPYVAVGSFYVAITRETK